MKPLSIAVMGAVLVLAGPAVAGCRDVASPGVDWGGCTKKLIMLPGARLNSADLTKTNFTSTDLGNATATIRASIGIRSDFKPSG